MLSRAATDVRVGITGRARPGVVVGAQAIKFAVKDARATKDVNFILNVITLREEPLELDAV